MIKKTGSKVQVWRGTALQTSSGLKKKDIIRVSMMSLVCGKRKKIFRYKSKKQQAKPKKSQKSRVEWSNCLSIARIEMNEKFPKTKKHLVLVLNPKKNYSHLKLTKEKLKWGRFLYTSARRCYNK
jgi:hypothetical protein